MIHLLLTLLTSQPDATVVCVKDSCYRVVAVKVARVSLRPGTHVIELK